MHRIVRTGAAILSLTAVFVLTGPAESTTVAPADLGPEAQRWVDETLARLTLEEKIGQLVFPSFFSEYTSSESETYERTLSG